MSETNASCQEKTHLAATAGRRGTERWFPIGLLSTVGKFGLFTLAPRGAAQEVEREMEHARKMALMDPRMLDTLRSPPPSTDTLGKKVQALDDEMKTILDRKDLDDRTKVTLYNQVLQRYNVLSDKHVKEPVRVITVNESGTGAGAAGAGVAEGAVRAPDTTSGIEADVVDTIPKTMQGKARRLMEHLKRDIAWTTRGELIHEGVPVAGSNVVDLVNDLLRKRKTDPTECNRSQDNSVP